MKLEVGMYIRYKGLNYDCPIIQKITKLETPGRCGGKYKVFTNKTNGWFIDSDYIEMEVKGNRIPQPSFNIVDLIEVGDYVNGYYVEDISKTFINVATGSNYFQSPTIYEQDIKSIVTKEQFEQMEYKVGE